MKLQEDKISKELIDKYPDLQEYQLKGKDRLKTQIKSIKGILEIITEEEDKEKFYEYINSYNSRKGKKPFKQISDKSANDEVDDNDKEEEVDDNNKEKEEDDNNKEVDDDNKEAEVKTKVKIKVKVKKKVKDDVKTDVKAEEFEKMKKQRDNVLKNYHNLQEKYDEKTEEIDNLSEIHKDFKKDYKEVCNERNKLQLAMEKKGWNKDLRKEFDKYKSFYQKYSDMVEELDKHKK